MSNHSLTINCLVLGKNPPSDFVFPVSIPRDQHTSDLQAAIKNGCPHILDVDEDLLYLWHVSIVVDHNFDAKMEVFVPSCSWNHNCRKLHPTQELADVFVRDHVSEHLHVVVQFPDDHSRFLKQRRLRSAPPEPPQNITPRTATVSALYEKLFPPYFPTSFVQVRGTPGSGKTTLALLLGQHIKGIWPNLPVIWIDRWMSHEVQSWSTYLERKGWKAFDETVFIFDEAQLTYWDGSGLWNSFFKSIHEYDCRAIIFANYGSPTVTGVKDTNMFIPDPKRVTLHSIDYKDGRQPVGILLTRPEFDDLISRRYPPEQHSFHLSFLDAVFSLTAGHVGAVCDLLEVILSLGHSHRDLKHSGEPYTWNIFVEKVDPRQLLEELEHTSAFGGGLPSIGDLKPAIARIFSAVLRKGFIMETDYQDKDDKDALQRCFHNGWLHPDKLDAFGMKYETGYLFPSPLHQWCLGYRLWETLANTTFGAKDLLTFSVEVISRYCPANLANNQRVGPGCIQRPSEAMYQDEFYRCSHDRSNGSIMIFPEFGIGNGRADLYFPTKKWGVEILRNGYQFDQHAGRFSQPELYAGSFPFVDYIVLDFVDRRPVVTRPDLRNHYHVVFGKDFHDVCILDNNLELVPGGEIVLLVSS